MRCLLALLAAAAVAAAAAEPLARDPALWPFAATSPWNTPLGDGAAWQPIASPRFAANRGGCLNCAGFSHPVFIATAKDPEVAIYRKGTTAPFCSMRVPAEAKPDAMGDGHLHLIDEQHRYVVEMWQAVRAPDGSISAKAVVRNELDDAGVYPSWHGVRAYGGSAIAGLIRSGELSRGIRHAVAIAVEQQALNRNAGAGKGWVWPASSCDNNNGYGASGNLHMGTLLGIPPEVDLRRSGLRGPALELGIALQDYGAYITDCTGTNLSIYAEPAAAEEVGRVAKGDIDRLVSLLQVVANNGPDTVGGGGKRRRQPAPPFADPATLARGGGSEPAIASGPADTSVDAGQALRLTVTASGSPPLTYRWRRGRSPVGGNTPELVIAAAQPRDAGTYTCTVGNPFGQVVSAAVQVTVVGGEAAPAPAPLRPPPTVVATWTARLRGAVVAGLGAGRQPQYRSDLFRGTVAIRELAADGTLTLALDGGSMQAAWDRLSDAERCSLALDVARGATPADHALAGFFLFLAGDPVAARTRLAQAGEEGAAVERAFVPGGD